jgi:hypothetical protein
VPFILAHVGEQNARKEKTKRDRPESQQVEPAVGALTDRSGSVGQLSIAASIGRSRSTSIDTQSGLTPMGGSVDDRSC